MKTKNLLDRGVKLLFLLVMLNGCGIFSRPARPASLPTVAQAPTAAAPATLEPSPIPATPTLHATNAPVVPTAAAIPNNIVYRAGALPAEVDPLTGLPPADPNLLNRRPVAVKIQMFPRGERPPMGISQADVVYDYYQNFGLTRFHAIFYGKNAAQVGPVRSARLLDLDLVKMYKSVFAFGSAEKRTYSKLFGAEFAPRLVVEGSANCPPMCRVDPNATNLLVTDTSALTAYTQQKGVDNTRPKLDELNFASAAPANGQTITSATLRYSISSYARWDYDAASGKYLRWQDVQEASDAAAEALQPLLDRSTNSQLTADNVVVLFVTHQYAFGTKPGVSEVIQIDLAGSGTGYAFRNGQVYQVTWNRANANAMVTLTSPDGSPYFFKPGNTWFQVIGKTSKITTPTAGALRFDHVIP